MTDKQAKKWFPRICPQKIQCCDAKYYLRSILALAKLCIAATRSLTGLSAFLDVSSLNLAVLRAPPFFLRNRRKMADYRSRVAGGAGPCMTNEASVTALGGSSSALMPDASRFE